MKIVSIVGARPQFIKLAPLSKEIRKYHDEIIVHTGQHFDKEMSASFFNDLKINIPDYNLNINSGSHAEQTSKMIFEIEKVLIIEKPDAVIIFGDTNSTLSAAIVCSKLPFKLFHIESGLRSFNKNMPEEVNRIMSDHMSDYLFAPTQTAMNNLTNEGLIDRSYLTGDIMVDSVKYGLNLPLKNDLISRYSLDINEFYLLTLHRPYNVDNPENIIRIFSILSEINSLIVFPVHPRTRNILKDSKTCIPENIILIKPVGYIDFLNLQKKCKKIITDSGGIQKEAYLLKKPCITLRSETEWVETLEAGWNLLINLEIDMDIKSKILNFNPTQKHESIYGNNVSSKMLNLINKLS